MIKKLFVLAQWLVVALLAGFIAWAVFRPKPEPDYQPETWRSWDGFMAISYAGIARHASEQYPAPAQLAGHLRALRDAGYQPIRPEDAAAFLAGRSPLPERAVLVLFEGGRKDSFIRATPILQQTGFIGTMAIPTRYLTQWGSAYLKATDLRSAAKFPQWSFASMGHHAVDEIPVTPDGGKGRFLTRRMWTGKSMETADEFAKRVTGDYYTSLDLLTEASRAAVITYLYPYGDAGTGPGADPEAARLNLEAVSARFSIAFTRADDPFNGPNSNPFSLSRLRVPGTWSGQQLVEELRRFEPRSDAVSGFADASRWFLQKGAALKDGTLLLPAESTAWIRGSEGWTDLECTVRMRSEPGALAALYLRYASPGSYLRVTLDGSNLRVQERLLDRMLGLASVPIPSTDSEHEIRVQIRGNRAWVWMDDQPVAGPLPLAPETDRGRVGFGSHGGAAQASLFQAKPSPGYYVFTESYSSLDEKYRPMVGAVLPAWFAPDRPVSVDAAQRGDALLAAAAGVEYIPVIANSEDLPPSESEAYAAKVSEALAHPALKPLINQLVVRGVSDHLSRALRARGFRIVHLIEAGEVREISNREGLKEAPYDRFLLNAEGADGEDSLDELLRICPARRLIVQHNTTRRIPLGAKTALRAEEFPEEEN